MSDDPRVAEVAAKAQSAVGEVEAEQMVPYPSLLGRPKPADRAALSHPGSHGPRMVRRRPPVLTTAVF